MSKILVIGDVIEDVIVIPEDEIRINTDTNATIQKSMGGQAANVASWLSYLGAETTFIGSVGIEDVANLTKSLNQHGIKVELQTSPKPTGSLVVLVSGGDRSMLTDRGANLDLDLGSIDPAGYSIVYLSGYSLLGRKLDEVASFANKVHSQGALLAIDPGSTGFITDHGVEDFKALLQQADLVFPNREEEQLLKLSKEVPLTIVTNAEFGATANWQDGRTITVQGIKTNSLDPTGAGDAFCAGFLARLVAISGYQELAEETVKLALETAVLTGSKAVALVGARPNH